VSPLRSTVNLGAREYGDGAFHTPSSRRAPVADQQTLASVPSLRFIDRSSVTNSLQYHGFVEFINGVYRPEVADPERHGTFKLPSQPLSNVGIGSQFFDHLQNAPNVFLVQFP